MESVFKESVFKASVFKETMITMKVLFAGANPGGFPRVPMCYGYSLESLELARRVPVRRCKPNGAGHTSSGHTSSGHTSSGHTSSGHTSDRFVIAS